MTDNLIPRSSPDSPGMTKENSQVVSVRLLNTTIKQLAILKGDRSFHIRQAVLEYLKKLSQNNS